MVLLFDNCYYFSRSTVQAAIGRIHDFLVLPASSPGTGNLARPSIAAENAASWHE
jgi:hypothetical protein